MLKKLVNKKSLTVIGLNAGTSADGLDLAVIDVGIRGKQIITKFVDGNTVTYNKKLRDAVHLAIGNKLSIDKLIELDRQLGDFYGRETARFMERLHFQKIKVDLIGSHGQTVRHLPGQIQIMRKKASGTMQIGHPESIAAITGLLTVADFRQADIASGGEGAPITSLPMWHLFADKKVNRVLLNIGGIANYFFFPRGGSIDKMAARDCGPGNSLLDLATEKYFGKKYDYNGRLAQRGKISKRLLTILLSDKFLKGKFGPSTGRERFGFDFLTKVEQSADKLKLTQYDILATLTELTAVGIKSSLNPILKTYDINEIDIFGGGVGNRFLIDRIYENLDSRVQLFKVDRLGINSDYLEAVCYALLGVMALFSIPAGLPNVTGADTGAICGRIVQPSAKH